MRPWTKWAGIRLERPDFLDSVTRDPEPYTLNPKPCLESMVSPTTATSLSRCDQHCSSTPLEVPARNSSQLLATSSQLLEAPRNSSQLPRNSSQLLATRFAPKCFYHLANEFFESCCVVSPMHRKQLAQKVMEHEMSGPVLFHALSLTTLVSGTPLQPKVPGCRCPALYRVTPEPQSSETAAPPSLYASPEPKCPDAVCPLAQVFP